MTPLVRAMGYATAADAVSGTTNAGALRFPGERHGDKCNSGIDCCGGFCYFDNVQAELVEPVGSCSPKMNSCARRDDRLV